MRLIKVGSTSNWLMLFGVKFHGLFTEFVSRLNFIYTLGFSTRLKMILGRVSLMVVLIQVLLHCVPFLVCLQLWIL